MSAEVRACTWWAAGSAPASTEPWYSTGMADPVADSLLEYRKRFPALEECVHFISHLLGAALVGVQTEYPVVLAGLDGAVAQLAEAVERDFDHPRA